MTGRDDRELEEALRRALENEASRVQIAGDGLERIRRRTAVRRGWSWLVPALAGAAAIAVVIAVVWGSGVLGSTKVPPATTTPSQPTPSSVSPQPSQTPTETSPTVAPGSEQALPVYYVGAQRDGPESNPPPSLVLFREFHPVLVDVGGGTPGSPGAPDDATRAAWVRGALDTMFANTPDDPDYAQGLWPTSTRTTAASYDSQSGRIVVDLTATGGIATADPPSGVAASDAATITLQQLVFTATAAAVADGTGSATSVLVRVDGAPLTELFGTTVTTPATRSTSVLASIWILAPVEGATVSSPVQVTGVAAVFEAQGQWRLTDDTGREINSGSFRTAESGKRLPFTIDLGTVAPGTYKIEVFDVGGLGLPGRGPSDTKTFTVQ